MEIYSIPKLLTSCPLCGGKLEYEPHPRCDNCHEMFEYDAHYEVFRHPKILDISYKNPESRLLSNLFHHVFKFRVYNGEFAEEYASMEAFLRSLWCNAGELAVACKSCKSPHGCREFFNPIRDEIAQLYGLDAVYVKNILPDWKKEQGFYRFEKIYGASGETKTVRHKVKRDSSEYQNILNKAYQCLFNDSRLFRMALCQTKGKTLIHSIGKDDPKETILTRKEFVNNLYRLREQF